MSDYRFCTLCEAPSRVDICHTCLGCTEEAISMSYEPKPRTTGNPPEKQLPVRVESLEPYIEEVKRIETYLLEVFRGGNPEPPVTEMPPNDDFTLENEHVPLLKPADGTSGEFYCFGKSCRGLRQTDDLSIRHHLMVFDLNMPDLAQVILMLCDRVRLNSPDYHTYLGFLQTPTALYGQLINLPKMYLRDEERGEFVTADSETPVSYVIADFPAVFRMVWGAGYQLIKLQPLNDLLDFDFYQLTGPHVPQDPGPVEVHKIQMAVTSHYLMRVIPMRRGDVVAKLGGQLALLYEDNQESSEKPVALLPGFGMVVLEEHKPHLVSRCVFDSMNPTERAKLGRVYVEGDLNKDVIHPYRDSVGCRVVRVDDDYLTLVKAEGETMTTIFEHNKMGPFYFWGTFQLRESDITRCAVSYVDVENSRLRYIGDAKIVSYSELDHGPYLRSPRVIHNKSGLLVKLPLLPPENEILHSADLHVHYTEEFRKVMDKLHDEGVLDSALALRIDEADALVAAAYFVLPEDADIDILFDRFDDHVSLDETLYVPAHVTLNPQNAYADLPDDVVFEISRGLRLGGRLSTLL